MPPVGPLHPGESCGLPLRATGCPCRRAEGEDIHATARAQTSAICSPKLMAVELQEREVSSFFSGPGVPYVQVDALRALLAFSVDGWRALLGLGPGRPPRQHRRALQLGIVRFQLVRFVRFLVVRFQFLQFGLVQFGIGRARARAAHRPAITCRTCPCERLHHRERLRLTAPGAERRCHAAGAPSSSDSGFGRRAPGRYRLG